MTEPLQVYDYFTRVLRRGGLEAVSFKDNTFVTINPDDAYTGILRQDYVDTLFAAHDDARRTKKPDPTINIVISLVSLNIDKGYDGLLLLEATLDRQGTITPVIEMASSPWIPADRLETPTVASREVMVGRQTDFFNASRLRMADQSQSETFHDAINLAYDLFHDVCGFEVEDYASANPDMDDTHWHIQELDRINAVGAILDTYEYLSCLGDQPPLITRLITGWQGDRRHERGIHAGNGLLDAALTSCGSMGNEFPLTDSQRRSVHAFLSGGYGDITAVSGPPGTGKTTMLQSVVANLITQHAIERDDPPVIVATSTNNQAVTNVIDSFSSVASKNPGVIGERWLPLSADGAPTDETLGSLAVYCPSKAKLENATKKYLVEQPGHDQTYTAYSTDAYLQHAQYVFLIRGNKALDALKYGPRRRSVDDIGAIQETIYSALVALDNSRRKLIHAMAKHGPGNEYLRLCNQISEDFGSWIPKVAELAACQDLVELDKTLDVSIRYVEFWLAVHYYEAQWLVEDDFIPEEERFKTTREIVDRYWRQSAALTPCFVMTAFMVPRYFKLYTRQDERAAFDTERIDLLIVDEAGQVDTPIGVAAFGLAKRALVVGDEKQLAPVWSLDDELDREIADGADIDRNQWEGDLKPRGMTCSPTSSLMRAASWACAWSFGSGHPGLFLSEHFRCHPDIISFCNELLYENLLVPSRQASSSILNDVTPAVLFVPVAESHDASKGSSRINKAEAEAIAQWIVNNYTYFAELYASANKKIAGGELIGVVTPFSAQASLITRAIRDAAAHAGPDKQLPDNLAALITVGTAHRLQGAERPIILFSSVYGDNSGEASFIDNNLPLMNVAVSRAKDLFIVFGASRRWGHGKVFSVLERYAQRSDGVFATERFDAELFDTELSGDEQAIELAQPTPESAHAASELQTPDNPPAPSQDDRAGVTVTTMVNQWRQQGRLRDEDATIKATEWNKRLHAAGVLEGAPGNWRPSELAARLGLESVTRHNGHGDTYASLEYAPRLQDLLGELYDEGNL